MTELAKLEERRERECRLTPEHALETLEEAAAWVVERGLVTITQDCSLPSLHAAVHEEPYEQGGRGFGSWPRTKWWWSGALAERPELAALKIRRGRSTLASAEVVRLADPLCRLELARAEEGAHGAEARRLVEHLAAGGPARLRELKLELGLETRTLRAVRSALERVGAVVARSVVLDAASGGHVHESELARWDQRFPEPADGEPDPAALLAAGVRAAVLAPAREARRWFSWPVPGDKVERLVAEGRIGRVGELLHA